MGARGAAARAAARRPRRRAPGAQPRLDRAASRTCAARDNRPRSQLRQGAGGALRSSRARHARARAGRGADARAGSSSTPRPRATTSCADLGRCAGEDRRGASRRVHPSDAGPDAAARTRETLGIGRASARPERLRQAAAQEPGAPRCARSRRSRRIGARCSWCRATPRRTRPSCASWRARSEWRPTCAGRPGCRRTSWRASTRRPPASCFPLSTRASGCRSWRRWLAACPSPAQTGRRSLRSPAPPPSSSTPRTSTPSPRRLSVCSPTASSGRGLAVAGRERAAAFTWERTAELTAASYARTLLPER